MDWTLLDPPGMDAEEDTRLDRYLGDIRCSDSAPFAPIDDLAGPVPMVATLRAMFNGSGIDAGDLRTEEFTG